jgi:hypothetical protein
MTLSLQMMIDICEVQPYTFLYPRFCRDDIEVVLPPKSLYPALSPRKREEELERETCPCCGGNSGNRCRLHSSLLRNTSTDDFTAVARRFASLGCAVSIAGRNEVLAKNVFWEMNLANPGPKLGKFYKVDLSSMAEVERFTNEVTKDYKDKGIDYLVLSAGGPPTGNWRGPTPEVRCFAVRF